MEIMEAAMQEVEKYHQYADECRRMAERAPGNDKDALLKIAEAWEQQAEFAHRRKRRA
jgi:hypothetical protein